MSKPDLAAIRARVEAATEGPWEWEATNPAMSGEHWTMRIQGKPGIRFAVAEYQHGTGNADFIANARQDVPALLTYIDELENQLDEVRALVGPDNESGMISASAIFHTIGTSNQGGDGE